MDMIGDDSDKLKDVSTYSRRPGGAPANLAVAASRLGADTKMTATVGKDHFGELMIQKLEQEDIDTSSIRKVNKNTTLAFVALNNDAEPDFSFYRGADMKIKQEQIEDNQDILHIGSLPLTDEGTAEDIIEAISETESKVSFDPNLREEIVDNEYLETLERVIGQTDILFAAEEEIKELGGSEELLDSVEEIVVTKGSEGAKIITEEETYSSKPPEVEVEDTTGAGDALAGAYLVFRHEGVDSALNKSVHAASLSIKEKGAMAALPTRKELKNSLESD